MRPRLGRLLEHDPRSRAFPARTATALVSRTHRHWGPVLDQGDLGSCTGNALTQARNTTPLRAGRPLLTEADAVTVYGRATALDAFPGTYPPEDTGSSGLAVCKAGAQLGWIRTYRHAFGLDAALAALVLAPVLIGINFYDGMFDPDPAGFIAPSGGLAGGHEMVLTRIYVPGRWVLGFNSWGPAWGDLGRFRMTFAVLGRLLAEDGDCTVPSLT